MKLQFKRIAIVLMAVALVAGQSCTKDSTDDFNDETNNAPTEDLSPPQIGITKPTAEFSYLSAYNTINIGGYSNDNRAVTKVDWISSSGRVGQANGTESWTAGDLYLDNGDNLITFISHDASDHTDTARILITYNQFFSFGGSLSINPKSMFVNAEKDVIFNIPITDNTSPGIESIVLLEVDALGNILHDLGPMYDDGDMSHGDDILGDGVFSQVLNMKEDLPGRIHYRVKVITSGISEQMEAFSEIGTITAVDEIPEAAVQDILSAQEDAYDFYGCALPVSGLELAMVQTVEFLNQIDIVSSSGLTSSGDIWIEFQYGLDGMILASREGDEGGSAMPPQVKGRTATAKVPLTRQVPGVKSPYLNVKKNDKNQILDRDVVLYAPNWMQFKSWGTEFLDDVNEIYTNSDCPTFNVEYLKNEEAGLDVLKRLGSYGTIVIHTHGSIDKDGNVIFLSGDKVDFEEDEMLDWITGNVIPIPHMGKSMWAVKPSFITTYNVSFPNSIIYNGSCESKHNNSMSNAFLTRGANTYFGFSEAVKSWFDCDVANQMFSALVSESKPVNEAFVPGQHDNNDPPAFFVMEGNLHARYSSDLFNPDYEEGNLSGWNVTGDGRVITQLGFIPPYTGYYMGIISTGLGYTDQVGSMSQNFCVPENATTLSVEWNFLSEEFLENIGSKYQDYFQVSIIDKNNYETILLYMNIGMIHEEYPLNLVSPDIIFDAGDVYGTGWLHSAFDISAFAGQSVSLVISAGDLGDSLYDTGILLDEILIK